MMGSGRGGRGEESIIEGQQEAGREKGKKHRREGFAASGKKEEDAIGDR